MKKIISVLTVLLLCFTFVFATGTKEQTTKQTTKQTTEQATEQAEESLSTTIIFTDSCNRTVEIPNDVTKVAVSGNVAKMFFEIVAPEYMTPYAGSLYGGKSTINPEQIIASGAQLIVDIGDYKKGIEDDLNDLQTKTGIPCVFIAGSLENMISAFESIGVILPDKKERCQELADFVDKTLTMAAENSAKITDSERKTVMFSGGSDGLGTNAKGSSQAQVLELVGCENAIVVENPVAKGNGNTINMEMLYNFDPDYIFLCEGSYYDKVATDSSWQVLTAVKDNHYYEIPCDPYCWLGTPPSLNMLIGVWYLGNIVYPQYYDYDLNEVTNEIYNLFWGIDCPYKF